MSLKGYFFCKLQSNADTNSIKMFCYSLFIKDINFITKYWFWWRISSQFSFHYPGGQPEMFHGKGGFLKLGHFDKYFIKNSRKKCPQGKISEFVLLDTLKTAF